MSDPAARQFWNQRAEADAFVAVDSRLEFGSPDLERFWAGGEKDLDLLLAAVGAELEPGDAVVEIGCGVGRLTRVLAARAASVRALDVSERMLELAREHNPELPNVSWLLGDGTSLAGVDDSSADVVVSHVVFQHIPDPEITLGYVREIGRVLRPGGWAAFQVSNHPSVHQPRGRAGRVRDAVGRLLRREPWHDNPYWLGSHIEIPALRAAAADGSMDLEGLAGEGTQYCIALTRRR
ncbi:MAG TPA: class I SAM-dependent methyltransferase [Thermoleophilaceae bacterium]|jgi:SAM-dependent methyltransferase